MKPTAILTALSASGVAYRLDGDTIKLRPRPERGIPPALLETVRQQKAELVAELRGRELRTTERQLTTDIAYLFGAEQSGHGSGAYYDDRINGYEIALLRYKRLWHELGLVA